MDSKSSKNKWISKYKNKVFPESFQLVQNLKRTGSNHCWCCDQSAYAAEDVYNFK